jgi:hypothetical protein
MPRWKTKQMLWAPAQLVYCDAGGKYNSGPNPGCDVSSYTLRLLVDWTRLIGIVGPTGCVHGCKYVGCTQWAVRQTAGCIIAWIKQLVEHENLWISDRSAVPADWTRRLSSQLDNQLSPIFVCKSFSSKTHFQIGWSFVGHVTRDCTSGSFSRLMYGAFYQPCDVT